VGKFAYLTLAVIELAKARHFIGSLKAQQTKISASVARTPRQNAAMIASLQLRFRQLANADWIARAALSGQKADGL
jgi:hypothetical protein